jgi:Polyketide cyclase / dehydrase and lipid transport
MNAQSENETGSSCGAGKCSFNRVLAKVIFILLAAIALFSAIVASRPNDFRVERSATMAASPAAVFEQVNDFHNWEAWSPWAKMDPNAKNSFEGPTSGEGAKFGWSGNSDVGEGNMEIVESKPGELVRVRLDFVRPMEGTNDVQFKIEPQGGRTKVTWSMAGKNNFMGKAIGLFMDCEKMVGDQYDQGLANLKTIVEAQPVK